MKTALFCIYFFGHFSQIFAANIVVELLATDADNLYWETKNAMHLTVGHIKNVDVEKFQKTISLFNEENAPLIQKAISKGFVVEAFSTNGFELGYHILEAEPETRARFDEINHKLYDFLIENSFGALSDKTSPKSINPKGYTPHIEFLETKAAKIPQKGTKIHFQNSRLIGRVQE